MPVLMAYNHYTLHIMYIMYVIQSSSLHIDSMKEKNNIHTARTQSLAIRFNKYIERIHRLQVSTYIIFITYNPTAL